ncbi:ATP-binding cassette domain-containing protein [Scopulibacillus cellulosilyticus]|uniref:ATP-binding cassette domain-containing protein n=1 Tax=Scopulibacillus cellulosilyticus TaxID=2665665 RepID=A0ABW2PUB0_9BACL
MSRSVVFENVTKKYNKNMERIQDHDLSNGDGEDIYALKNISFTADKGDVIGIIGIDGAGKSTLSNLIAGIESPTSGSIEIEGKTYLNAISAGLNNHLTGREYIESELLMHGFNKNEIQALMPDIIYFADIGKLIDQPMENYSNEMMVRLGFAISVNIDPEVLVIDGALTVSDQIFTDKYLNKMIAFKQRGKTIFFISHSIGQLKKICHKALWLEAGKIRAFGPIDEVIPQYEKFLQEFKTMSKEEQKDFKQQVQKRRSQVREGQVKKGDISQNQEVPIDKIAQLRQERKIRHKRRSHARFVRRTIALLVIFIVVLGGAGYAMKFGLPKWPFGGKANEAKTAVSPKAHVQKNVQHHKDTKAPKKQNDIKLPAAIKQDDIRYIKVPGAYIHAKPDMDSVAVGMAYFGQAYKVQKAHQSHGKGGDWLKITGQNNVEGWINSKTVTDPKELNDDKVAKSLDKQIKFTPSLKETMPMIGKQKGEEKPFGYTKYMYKEDRVVGFTINIKDSSISEIKKVLGEPQLEKNDTFIYHGRKYDFILTTLKDGEINQLTVKKREQL